jgi:hypothetical protein
MGASVADQAREATLGQLNPTAGAEQEQEQEQRSKPVETATDTSRVRAVAAAHMTPEQE